MGLRLRSCVSPMLSSRRRRRNFGQRLEQGETLGELLPEAFAVGREAAKRVLHMRHFDVQLIGGIVLHEGENR